MSANKLATPALEQFAEFAPPLPEITDTRVEVGGIAVGEFKPFGVDLMTPAGPKPGEVRSERNTPHTTCIVQGHGKNTYRMTDDD